MSKGVILNVENKIYLEAFLNFPRATVILNEFQEVVMINESFSKLFGFEACELIGKNLNNRIVPDHLLDEANQIFFNSQKNVVEYETIRCDKNKKILDVIVMSYCIKFKINDFEFKGLVATYIDNKDKKNMRNELIKERVHKEQLFKRSPNGILILDPNGFVLDVNKSFEQMFGFKKDEIINKDITSIIVPKEQMRESDEFKKNALEEEFVKIESVRKCKDSNLIEVEITGYSIVSSGKILGIYCIYNDINEKKKFQRELQYQSFHDVLTGFYNRRAFEDYLEKLRDSSYKPLSLMICDLDGLKIINDTLGHMIGDKMISQVANVIKSVFDKQEQKIFRIGGDEFAIIVHQKEKNFIISKYKEIKDILQESNKLKRQVPLNLSMGYCHREDLSISISQMFNIADDYMYREKLILNRNSKTQIIDFILDSMENEDYFKKGHYHRVFEMLDEFCEFLKVDDTTIKETLLLCKYHHIGKIDQFLDDFSITDKVTRIQKHCEIGARIANFCVKIKDISDYILKHHEKWDGSGHPFGLMGEEIPLACRIFSIVDFYDKMKNRLAVRPLKTPEELLLKKSSIDFDPELVEKFMIFLNQKNIN